MARPRPDGDLAAPLHRLSVLIAAGIGPRSAWLLVAEAAEVAEVAEVADPVLAELAAELVTEPDPGVAIARTVASHPSIAWRSLAAAWAVATASGAPLAPALRSFAEGLRDREAARRDIQVALTGPRSTARIVLVLPGVAVVLGLMMGVDLIATLTSPLGATSALLGVGLIVVARRWMRRLLRAAEPPPPTVGLALDLLAVAAGGGRSPEAAAELVAAELERVGIVSTDAQTIAQLVALSRRAGAPLGELARADAAEARARARSDAREGAERLAVRLMLPLGVCVLPSFLLLGVVPMLLGIISSTSSAF